MRVSIVRGWLIEAVTRPLRKRCASACVLTDRLMTLLPAERMSSGSVSTTIGCRPTHTCVSVCSPTVMHMLQVVSMCGYSAQPGVHLDG